MNKEPLLNLAFFLRLTVKNQTALPAFRNSVLFNSLLMHLLKLRSLKTLKRMKLMQIIFTLLLLNGTALMKAQIFGIKLSTYQYYLTTFQFPSDNKYRVLLTGKEPGQNSLWKNSIMVYDTTGICVDSIYVSKYFIPGPSKPLIVGEKLYYAGLLIDSLSPATLQYFVICEFDTLFNLVQTYKLSALTDSLNTVLSLGIMQARNSFFVGYSGFPVTPSKVFKLNGAFQKVDSVSFNAMISMESAIAYDSTIVIGTSFSNNSCATYPFAAQLTYSTNLQLLECYSSKSMTLTCGNNPINMDLGTFYPGAFYKIGYNKTFMLTEFYQGCEFPIQPYSHNGVFTAIKSVSAAPQYTLFRSNKTDQYLLSISCSHFCSEKDKITFVAHRGKRDGFWNITSNNYNTMLVYRMDTLGNLIWLKEHGGDLRYSVTSALNTPDGGCLIAGMRYDSISMNTNPPKFENFLLKLTSTGEITGLQKHQIVTDSGFNVYPNPSKSEFNVTLASPCKMGFAEICDLNGKRLLGIEFAGSKLEVKLGNAPSGIYYLKLVTENNVFVGRLIKE